MGVCLTKIGHSCGSSNGLQVFEREDGTVDGYCYSCDTYVRHPYEKEKLVTDLPKKRLGLSKEEVAERMEEISKLSAMDLRERRLRKDALDQFGIKIGLSEEDGKTPAFHHYPYTKDGELVAYKTRLIENKRMWSVGNQSDVDLFGWEQAIATGARRLILVEGECDAAAMWKILQIYQDPQFAEHTPAVCSLPHGAASAGKDLAKLAPKIRRHFKEISFAFDNDEAGELATEAACKVFPEATVVTLPAKDANECIKTCGKAAFKAATFNAKKPKNTRLVWGGDLVEDARKEAELGVSYPWKKLTELTRGIRLGETIYFGAGVKMGKSEIVNALADHLIREHGWNVFMAKPEENNVKTMKLLVGKAAGRIFHDPNIPFDYEAYDKAAPLVADKVCMVNIYQHLGWDTLKGDIIAAASMGCKAIIIDPITALMPENASEANEALQKIAKELAAMAMDLQVVVFIFCHLKAPLTGEPHERGGTVLSTQFAGSRAMMRSCNYMIGMEGNKDSELSQEERNMRELVLLEDREFGVVGRVKLYWDYHTGLFNEVNV